MIDSVFRNDVHIVKSLSWKCQINILAGWVSSCEASCAKGE